MKPRKILFITERPLMVVGFRELLYRAGMGPEHAILGPAELARGLRPEDESLIVIDADLAPNWETLVRLRQNTPRALFVLWSGQITPQFVQAAIEAGMDGLLSTRLPVDEAARTILQICQGERKFRFDSELQPQARPATRLTRREQQVLMMAMEGLKNREIAAALRTTEGSVKVYLNRVFRKTGARNRYELALVARRFVPGTPEISREPAAETFDSTWMFTGEAVSGASRK